MRQVQYRGTMSFPLVPAYKSWADLWNVTCDERFPQSSSKEPKSQTMDGSNASTHSPQHNNDIADDLISRRRTRRRT